MLTCRRIGAMITSTLTRLGLLETVELKLTIPKDGLLYAAISNSLPFYYYAGSRGVPY